MSTNKTHLKKLEDKHPDLSLEEVEKIFKKLRKYSEDFHEVKEYFNTTYEERLFIDSVEIALEKKWKSLKDVIAVKVINRLKKFIDEQNTN